MGPAASRPWPGPLAVRIAASSSREPGQGERDTRMGAPPPLFCRTSNDKKTPAAIVGRGENNNMMERDTCGPYGYTSSSDFAPAPGRVF